MITHPIVFITLAILLGLIVGSFLNVVIVRLPIMLEQSREQPFNLFIPRSQCPYCQSLIKMYYNIPIISYLFLRGRCAVCKNKISIQYPIVEAVTAFCTALIAFYFMHAGSLLITGAYIILTWILISLFFIDLKNQILPDSITLGALWLGLILSLFYTLILPDQAISGAITGYGLLWITGTVYQLVRKKAGMGHGDYKMLAMLGAWMGSEMVVNILLLAVLLGLFTSVILLMLRRISTQQPIPFGPFIAVAGWIGIFTGPWFTSFLRGLL